MAWGIPRCFFPGLASSTACGFSFSDFSTSAIFRTGVSTPISTVFRHVFTIAHHVTSPSAMNACRTARLFTGAQMPLLGLGTWKSKPGEAEGAVKVGIGAGYRHVDCAAIYRNQKEVGSALKDSFNRVVCKREDTFIVSKLWNTKHDPRDVRPACEETLKDLQLDYLDLYLIHWPFGYERGENMIPFNPNGSLRYQHVPLTDIWKAMEELVDAGLVKHIGLSNFNSVQIDKVSSSINTTNQHGVISRKCISKACIAALMCCFMTRQICLVIRPHKVNNMFLVSDIFEN